MLKKYLPLLLLLPLLFSACRRDQAEIDEELIQDYIADNNLDAQAAEEGLYVVIDSAGTGTSPTLSDDVTVHYRGYLLNGDEFDSSYDNGQPLTFALSGLIRGWQIGLPYFKEGGGGILLVPSALGYGNNQVGIIPRNSVLVFDIELIAVN